MTHFQRAVFLFFNFFLVHGAGNNVFAIEIESRYEDIQYNRCEIFLWEGRWQVVLERTAGELNYCVIPDVMSPHQRGDLGSFWYQVEVIDSTGKVRCSPGLERTDARGLSPDVFRVSIRQDDGYLGFLTAFFNVPGLFGSTIYQSENFIGIDCADVLVAAFSLWKGKKMAVNESVRSVVKKFPMVKGFGLAQGNPSIAITWNNVVFPGDFIAVKYEGGEFFQHIGALYQDSNGNGLLDGDDMVLHAGPEPLHMASLAESSFDGEVVILRPQ
jgi:hypothetical protein